jgi:hypothetical protein
MEPIQSIESKVSAESRDHLLYRLLFILARVQWELSDGAQYTGGNVSDGTYEDICAILKEARVS